MWLMATSIGQMASRRAYWRAGGCQKHAVPYNNAKSVRTRSVQLQPRAEAEEHASQQEGQSHSAFERVQLQLNPAEVLATLALSVRRDESGAPRRGVVVKATSGNSEASLQARPGDRVLAVDGQQLDNASADELRAILRSRREEDVETVSLLIEQSSPLRFQQEVQQQKLDKREGEDVCFSDRTPSRERERRRIVTRNQRLNREGRSNRRVVLLLSLGISLPPGIILTFAWVSGYFSSRRNPSRRRY